MGRTDSPRRLPPRLWIRRLFRPAIHQRAIYQRAIYQGAIAAARRPTFALAFALAAFALAMTLAPAASAYESRTHQRLTFLAAKQLNRCLAENSIPHLSPLQVRAIANSNAGLADSNFVARLFRWS